MTGIQLNIRERRRKRKYSDDKQKKKRSRRYSDSSSEDSRKEKRLQIIFLIPVRNIPEDKVIINKNQ